MIRNLVSQAAHRFPASLSVFGSIVSIVLFSAALTAVATAQTTQQPEADEVLRVSTDLIVFPARVRDKKGRRPDALTAGDLHLKDPDHATTSLYFAAGVDRVAMIFALDESGSL